MSKYVTLEKTAYEKMCSLIRESYSVADAIDDENIASNSAYSSQKIEELLSDIDAETVNGHTVKSDVPENAVFTDTVYDDTDIKAEIAKKADATAIPSKVSELENDSNYLSSIPEEYVTETELSAKGYLTEHQDLSAYATKEEIPTVPSKVSELTNDSNYQTAEQVNSTVTTEIAKIVADAPEDFDTLKEMSDWIAGHENDASAMNSAISDNKTAIASLQTDKADKSEIPTTVAELSDSGDYAKTADVNDSISTLQTDKANASDLTAHTDDADIHVTADDKTLWNTVDDKVDKTSILTALDNYATDNQVYSAKALNTELDGVVKKTDIVDNLTSTDTDKPLSANQGKILNDTKLNKTDANKLNCVTIDNVSLKEYILTNFTGTDKTYYLIAKTTCTDLPKASNFYITVEMPGLYTYKVTAKELNDSNGRYVCTYRTISSSWTAWEKVCTTTVADVPKTQITSANPTDFRDSGNAYYTVLNGICHVSLWGVMITNQGSNVSTGVVLPKPLFSGTGTFLTGSGTGTPSGFAYVEPHDSILTFDNAVPNQHLFGSFSYPVAES